MTSTPSATSTSSRDGAIAPRRRVVVVGAGVAGLTVARDLSPSSDVVVVDKGRGVGGRLATRRIGAATFDHGAQFITTHTPEFAAIVAEWQRAAVAECWFRGQIGPAGVLDADGHPRFRGVVSMNAIAKHLAVGLDVRVSTQVAALEASGAGWLLRFEGGAEREADAVVLTAPVPQALALLAAGGVELSGEDTRALEAIRYEPCLAVLAALEGPSGLEGPGAIRPAAGPIDWMADNQRKGVSAVPAVTLHATPAFSSTHWESGDDVVTTELLGAAGLASRPIDGQVQVQRWRFARPAVIHPERCLVAGGVAPLVLAGDAFGGAKVEGAVLSGAAAASALNALFGRLDGRTAAGGGEA